MQQRQYADAENAHYAVHSPKKQLPPSFRFCTEIVVTNRRRDRMLYVHKGVRKEGLGVSSLAVRDEPETRGMHGRLIYLLDTLLHVHVVQERAGNGAVLCRSDFAL